MDNVDGGGIDPSGKSPVTGGRIGAGALVAFAARIANGAQQYVI